MAKLAITNTIRALRFQHNEMTQQQLAEVVGVTRQTIAAIEAARYSPSLEVAFKIAIVFNLPLEKIFQYRQ
ncbi:MULTISPECIES: helix-turn-helix transcriptional regulator [Pseudoalteromonas]|jgi:putative transcriptional regulator|uniref:Helix-turn-helix transcriptional regulator n=1 Tax=Pseudoalteromonas rhizosphaerae TaxID=2518973 RepID=A0ABW8KXF4_9GAMM|nr:MULTISPECIES: helix-turn-helix transcriptional regulator [Pseudoalteromonas]MBB1295006.1 helix-turn-helix transcriptional regulator [Pseudoalteromonas sp. SR41-4]MBB1302972.1 helix-turn-helix transcriptional regulator [Pseudoalteromonas sp. SR44-8]MBB1311157.1 helix-turn-helix transcriptional regulator [Pseudoalteromonas sp. SR41-8]MBB1342220.1 helix-turn-helix transcriptional regulator [Pseudoalteromonas sp. SR45-6]MBB1399373.1 helix-turn-helix transcriptional regulator [Pseudoalteromonas |tara:strand:+ start:5975 stop:6187 length:213 start_codon:yes stop_codon:yes gene_type:complete